MENSSKQLKKMNIKIILKTMFKIKIMKKKVKKILIL